MRRVIVVVAIYIYIYLLINLLDSESTGVHVGLGSFVLGFKNSIFPQ